MGGVRSPERRRDPQNGTRDDPAEQDRHLVLGNRSQPRVPGRRASPSADASRAARPSCGERVQSVFRVPPRGRVAAPATVGLLGSPSGQHSGCARTEQSARRGAAAAEHAPVDRAHRGGCPGRKQGPFESGPVSSGCTRHAFTRHADSSSPDSLAKARPAGLPSPRQALRRRSPELWRRGRGSGCAGSVVASAKAPSRLVCDNYWFS